jgi:hypothetical protein
MCKDPRRRKISRYLRVLQGSKRKCGVHRLARSTTWRRRGPWTVCARMSGYGGALVFGCRRGGGRRGLAAVRWSIAGEGGPGATVACFACVFDPGKEEVEARLTRVFSGSMERRGQRTVMRGGREAGHVQRMGFRPRVRVAWGRGGLLLYPGCTKEERKG